MAGGTSSPQCHPTDLSMKTLRGDEPDTTKRFKDQEYNTDDSRKSRFKFKSDMAAYYATFDKPNDFASKSVIKSTERHQERAIRNAITAITKSLTPTTTPVMTPRLSMSREGVVKKVPPEDAGVFVYSDARTVAANIFRSSNAPTMTKSPDVEIIEQGRLFRLSRTTPTTPSDLVTNSPGWRVPTMHRPQYLDLHNLPDMQTISPDSGLGSATPIQSMSGSTTSPETPSGTMKCGKKRKRKTGAERGWKFHDLSNDGGSNRKRTYAQNKMEIEILQRFQEHVCVKSVPTPDGNKDKLIIVEPSEVTDSDLVRCGTALRMLFDKEAGTYKLQLLPYTLEEGPLNDHERVLQAVSKMLGFNNEVLCPTTFKALLRSGGTVIHSENGVGPHPQDAQQHIPKIQSSDAMNLLLPMNSEQATQSVDEVDSNSVKLLVPINPKQGITKSLAHQRDALLRSLNSDLTRYNNAMADATASGRKTCLMWHSPHITHAIGRRPKKIKPVTKCCVNCTSYTPSPHPSS